MKISNYHQHNNLSFPRRRESTSSKKMDSRLQFTPSEGRGGNDNRKKWWTSIVIIISVAIVLFFALPPIAHAQDDPIPLIHIVSEGENLTYIASFYGLTADEMLTANGMTVNDVLFVGRPLIVPGREGAEIESVYFIEPGDTVMDVAAAFNTTETAVLQTNNLINPAYAPPLGSSLVVMSRTGSAFPRAVNGVPHIVIAGESLTSIAAQYGISPLALAEANDLSTYAHLFAGERLRVPIGENRYRFLPGEWVDVNIRPFPTQQGSTLSIYVDNLLNGRPAGSFANQTLHFTPYEDGYIALIGLDAFTEPGTHTLALSGTGERPWTPYQLDIPITSSGYATQEIVVPEELDYLLAPEIRAGEDVILAGLYGEFDEQQYWDGLFQMPVTGTIITAGYGDSRSYNGGPYEIFHTGIDFGGSVGTPIVAPANGIITYAGAMALHGNTMVVNHGLGVVSAYFHLSAFTAQVGDVVAQGEEIALGGGTGLSTGPHLHWDLRVNGQAIDGRQWLNTVFP